MTDVFDEKILCRKCNVEMKQGVIEKNGLQLRAVKCHNCQRNIIHPADLNASERFNNLRGRTFNVKLRVVGNSHAVSIPKEIVDFMNEQHRQVKSNMDDMVRLCMEDFKRLSLNFGDEEE